MYVPAPGLQLKLGSLIVAPGTGTESKQDTIWHKNPPCRLFMHDVLDDPRLWVSLVSMSLSFLVIGLVYCLFWQCTTREGGAGWMRRLCTITRLKSVHDSTTLLTSSFSNDPRMPCCRLPFLLSPFRHYFYDLRETEKRILLTVVGISFLLQYSLVSCTFGRIISYISLSGLVPIFFYSLGCSNVGGFE